MPGRLEVSCLPESFLITGSSGECSMKVELSGIVHYIFKLIPFLAITFEYVFLSLFFGTLLGFLTAMAKLGKSKLLRVLAQSYTTVMRCIPSIVMLFVVYFIVPAFSRLILGINIDGLPAMFFVVLTFTLVLGASLSEMMRSAYQAVDKGQLEAALSAGLSFPQAFIRIILPQAFFFSIPNWGNALIYLLKEGALAFTIGLLDVMGEAYYLNSLKLGADVLEIYWALAFIYWPLAIGIERLFKFLENKFNTQKTTEKGIKQPRRGRA
jgi:L-cystine transport system permease protein